MISFRKIIKICTNLRLFLKYLGLTGIYSLLSDKNFCKLKYWIITGYSLNLDNPKGFCEKLQWLKLNDRRDIYTILVDKYKVRNYVSGIIGEKYLIPILGVWNRPEEIDFEKLPNQFVLKCNHNSGGGMCVCLDKTKLDINLVKRKLKDAMNFEYYSVSREWAYKNVEKRIICEKYMKDDNINKVIDFKINEGLIDYKFYCFNGIPKFLYVSCACIENGKKHDKLSFYNLNWTKAKFYRIDHPQFNADNLKPSNLDEMIKISHLLSKNIPFVRVDLYNINNNIYFSELTLSPGGGFGMFYPYEYELEIGNYINIDNIKQTT